MEGETNSFSHGMEETTKLPLGAIMESKCPNYLVSITQLLGTRTHTYCWVALVSCGGVSQSLQGATFIRVDRSMTKHLCSQRKLMCSFSHHFLGS
jgi:hypothetical protein